jgi:DNA topoisomerase-1
MINIDALLYNADWPKRTEDNIPVLRILGGVGSGNFGHFGRPGEIGGSAEKPASDLGGGAVSFRPPSKADTERLNSLHIPPAGKNVRINPDPKAALQATWTDAKGRTQYRYSKEHSADAAAEKFERLKAFNAALPALRDRISKDLHSPDPAIREAASVLHLIDKTGFRIGSDADTGADKQAYGATTLTAKHVDIDGNDISFKFTGKKGVTIQKDLTDASLASVLKPRVEKGGSLFDVNGADVRDYLHEHAEGFTPKDFRTWHGTDQALRLIKDMPLPKTAKELKEGTKKVATGVAAFLGNTPSVALSSYIDPAVFSKWKAK